MCLAKAYGGTHGEELILQDIARLEINGDTIELESLFGDKRVVTGELQEIDFMKSLVTIRND